MSASHLLGLQGPQKTPADRRAESAPFDLNRVNLQPLLPQFHLEGDDTVNDDAQEAEPTEGLTCWGSKQWWKGWICPPPPPNLQPLLPQFHRPFGNEGECGARILICFCKMQQKSSRSIYWIHPSFFLSSRTDLAWVGMHVSCNVFANIQRLQWQTSAIRRHSGHFLISLGG